MVKKKIQFTKLRLEAENVLSSLREEEDADLEQGDRLCLEIHFGFYSLHWDEVHFTICHGYLSAHVKSAGLGQGHPGTIYKTSASLRLSPEDTL
jgi:hypothetical protein